jgi:eukaryotic-like serine/threonine-protein kinase
MTPPMSEPRRIGHYLLEERLGAGGMGEVYRATDMALGRTAAVKLIPQGADEGLRVRLLAEVEHSARLQHPVVATFFDGGLDGGVAWLAMEYVPGETLRARLARGALGAGETVRLAMALLEGLAHAHAARVLHRDIKPENIMVRPDGRVKLLDFGLARALAADAAESTRVNLTGAGTTVGTIGYMPPEQLRGEHLDERADIFSLAAVLYECLAGRPAFAGHSAVERITAVLGGEAAPLPAALVPERVAAAVMRGLARDRDARPASAPEWLREFRSLAGDSSGAVAVAGPATLAIVDFENLARRDEDAWLGSGIAESLGADLTRVPGLQVFARERVLRAMAEAGEGADPLLVSQRLGSRLVLTGSFQKLGSRLRVTARLADVASGRLVFAEKLDGAIDDVFEMQDRLAAQVAEALDLHKPTPAAAKPQLSAWECYARGREEFLQLNRESIARARELFEAAVAIDPQLAEAHAGLAGMHAMSFTFTSDPSVLRRALEHAERAIGANPQLADAYVWRGYARWRLGDRDAGLADERRAASLKPEQGWGHYFEAAMLLEGGRAADALAPIQRAVACSPTYTYSWLVLGWAHMECGQLDEAAWCLSRCRDLEGTAPDAHVVGAGAMLAEAQRRRGLHEEAHHEALAALERVESGDHMYRDSQRVMCLLALGRILLAHGRPEAAAAALQQAVGHVRGRPHTLGGGFFLVQALALLGHATSTGEPLDEAAYLLTARPTFDFSWGWSATLSDALVELAITSAALGRGDRAREWLEKARDAGASAGRLAEAEAALTRH